MYKQDWKANDYFNLSDYNELNNEILKLQKRCLKLYSTPPQVTLKTDYSVGDIWDKNTINNIENSLDSLAEVTNTSNLYVSGDKIASAGGKAWDYIALNRIGANMELISNTIQGRDDDMTRLLQFECGGGLF